ncbi:MAG: GAF domain-containing protein [Candidatus Devosia phytovorans]|uniref:histidine kinase n=1 Tax=Candidatus Devosia phytovorans TaxID=3121372 RepID=A0AAJ5VWJ9_9HYPH|nr:ATP-binding protein [Devosia sp.]WEK06089.1 MAG: GAF domain-containing protein [Devosia sp.]
MNGPTEAQIDNCAAEPIRIPGGIQPHGALLVVDPDTRKLLQASANAQALLGDDLASGTLVALDAETTQWISDRDAPSLLQSIAVNGNSFTVSGHHMPQGAVLEFELIDGSEARSLEQVFPKLQTFADEILPLGDPRELGAAVADQVRAITGFNRVMIYSFDPEWHGTVMAQSSDGVLPNYLDLRFPATDIPAQARALYALSPLRMIPDADYVPVPLVPVMSPVDGQPLELSYASLRSVSPVHLQYMRNMGTWASMSISIVVEGKLWGLISCHSEGPRRVPPQVRAACNFVAKIFSLQISAIERGAHAAQRIQLKRRETELVARLSRADAMAEELERNPDAWLALANASGAAIITEEEIRTAGDTPGRDSLIRLAAFLESQGKDRFETDRLSTLWPEGSAVADTASGILAVSISQLYGSYVIWFRPEVVRTVTWGGDPRKSQDAGERLTPRTSFAQWKEELHERAVPWTAAEVESADDFRNALINFVLRRAEERAEMTEELERSNKELESFSYSVSHDLRAPFRHIVGYAELLTAREDSLDDKSQHYLRSIIDAALSAGRLVDDLLNFSQLGRTNLEKTRVDMNKLVNEVRHSLEQDLVDRQIDWQVANLPPAWGDGALIRQALANLVENAVKYSRDRTPAVIQIGGESVKGHTTYWVRDNGAGFEMEYVHKLFGVFQRLHRMEDFAGTGIGLALTKRIVNRHCGTIKAEGAVNKGATFTFSLPEGGKKSDHA